LKQDRKFSKKIKGTLRLGFFLKTGVANQFY